MVRRHRTQGRCRAVPPPVVSEHSFRRSRRRVWCHGQVELGTDAAFHIRYTFALLSRSGASRGTLSGLGDISVVGNYWLRDPGKASIGNVAFGLGVKTPSGSNTVRRQVFLANGQVLDPPVDQSIQLGDGGWGVIAQAQAFRQIYHRWFGYTYEWYLLSPKEMTNVPSPITGVNLSVPDVYSARVGASYMVAPRQGFSLSLGTRVDGIRERDLVGGNDGFRRPGYTLYLEPGLAMGRGLNTFTLSVPLRVHQDFKRGPVDVEHNSRGRRGSRGEHPGSGGL